MTILHAFEERDAFTETEVAIIDYLQVHFQSIDSLTISQLAKDTFTSNASIIRLCHKLDFQGFRDFRLALVAELTSSRYLDKEVDFTHPFQEESSQAIVNGLFSLYKNTMDQVQSLLSLDQLEKMAEQIKVADRLFLFGYGDVKLTLKSFINKLVKINYFPILATENDEEHRIITHLKAGDVALFVSYSGNNEAMLSQAQQLRRQGVIIQVITANQKSPLIAWSSSHLMIPDLEKDDKVGTFYSQLAFDYLLNVIYTILYQSRKSLK